MAWVYLFLFFLSTCCKQDQHSDNHHNTVSLLLISYTVSSSHCICLPEQRLQYVQEEAAAWADEDRQYMDVSRKTVGSAEAVSSYASIEEDDD